MRMDKKNYQQVYLEECKYRVKKIQMSRFISTEVESDSDSEAESKSETELMRKLESGSKFWFWIRHFTLNNFDPCIFVGFE